MRAFIYNGLRNPIYLSTTSRLTNLQLHSNALIIAGKPFSSLVRKDGDLAQEPLLVSYLVDSCSLSPKRASELSLRLGHKLKLKKDRADSVLELLRNHGFTATHFSKLFSVSPSVLANDPEKTLLPKIKFLYSIGFSGEDLRHFFSYNPVMANRSLQRHIVPLYNFIRDILKDDNEAVQALKNGGWLLQPRLTKHLIPNISLLKETGVPQSRIGSLLRHGSSTLLMKPADFRKLLEQVVELGLNPSKSSFVIGCEMLSKRLKSTRERCIQIYREWGYAEDDIWKAFAKQPCCFSVSEKKLRSTLEFLVNKVGYVPEDIVGCPNALKLSLDRRIIPRCSVVRALSLMGLRDKKLALRTVLLPSEKDFVTRFIKRYDDKSAPILWSVYQGKLDPFELDSAQFTKFQQERLSNV